MSNRGLPQIFACHGAMLNNPPSKKKNTNLAAQGPLAHHMQGLHNQNGRKGVLKRSKGTGKMSLLMLFGAPINFLKKTFWFKQPFNEKRA